MRYPIRQVVSVVTSIILTITTLIGLPIKALHHHLIHDPQCAEDTSFVWTPYRVKIYARGLMATEYPQWNRSEWKALDKLWTQESHWNHKAKNPDSTAYGVAQVLNTKLGTPAPQQVARGLSYINHRYGKPSTAWAHERKHGWY
jgi:hypothetical protein